MSTFRVGLMVGAEREFTKMRIGDADILIEPAARCVPGERYVLEVEVEAGEEALEGTITEGSVMPPSQDDERDKSLPVVRPTEQFARLRAGEPVYVPRRAG